MTCAKQTVIARLVCANGKEYQATNYCYNPQTLCPRANMPTGHGYELCKSVCRQHGHAEVNVLELAGSDAIGSTLYLSGHTYACKPCLDACTLAGVDKVVIADGKYCEANQ